MPGHHHRAGGLRQSNKKNKRTKASKRSVARAAGGKVMGRTSALHGIAQQSKADRRNHLQQRRDAKRTELLRKRRGVDGQPAPPRVVGIIALGKEPSVIEERVRDVLIKDADKIVRPHDAEQATVSCRYEVHKKQGNLTVLTCGTAFAHYGEGDNAAVLAALDLARVCDLMVFVLDGNATKLETDISEIHIGSSHLDTSSQKGSSVAANEWDHLISERGDRILTALKAQGLPSLLTLLLNTEIALDDAMTMQSTKSLRRLKVKRNLELKRYASRFATTEFGTGNDKVIEIDLDQKSKDEMMDEDVETFSVTDKIKTQSIANFVRAVCSMSASPSKWVEASPRPYVLSDSYKYDHATKELHLTGFVRGPIPLNVNALFHIPGVGTHLCKIIKEDAAPLSRRKETSKPTIESDPDLQESLDMFASPDALEGEQNLIGFDEEEEDMENETDGDRFARPAGWSDYQSAWLDAVDEDAASEHEDNGELADELNAKFNESSKQADMDLEDSNIISPEERHMLHEQRRKENTEHQEFPDEVQVDENVNARDRFARYRSLKSFRKSPWDPKENLPDDYASIFHISNFKTTQRSVMNYMKDVAKEADFTESKFWGSSLKDSQMTDDESEDDDLLQGHVPSGSYITLTMDNVEPDAFENVSSGSLLVAVGLLEHENKVSVLHMGLTKNAEVEGPENLPIKSKDTLIIRCGWRTWKARPIFSQHNLNCDKHKFERYAPPAGAFFAASVFGPVTYSPCPVLVFREDNFDEVSPDAARQQLVASGSVIGADAERIVVKRVILTGYPVRVHKRFATVKYMFYNPEDVKWFKPASLYTKHGLQGNILESVGDHGTMKCLFNAPIKQHDTVCLPLFKRVFPKFAECDAAKSHGAPVLKIW